MDEDRKNALGLAAAGGTLLGGATAGSMALDRMLETRKLKTPVRAAASDVKRLVRRTGGPRNVRAIHAPYVAGKLGATSLKAVGLPLAAYGAFNAISPRNKVAALSLRDDVVRPTMQHASGLSHVDHVRARRGEAAVVKSVELTTREVRDLRRRKQVGRRISEVSGTMGLAALALRAPEAARLAQRIPRVAASPRLARVVRYEKPATQASNALGITAVGTGSVGSFNYAAQQKLERKQVRKAGTPLRRSAERTGKYIAGAGGLAAVGGVKKLSPEKKAEAMARAKRNGRRYPNAYDNMISGGAKFSKALPRKGFIQGIGRVQVLGSHGPDHFIVLDGRDARRIVHRSRLAFAPAPKTPSQAKWKQERLFKAADDAFLRRYRDRISPGAEEGYSYLKRGRNEAVGLAGLNAALTPVNAHFAVSSLRRGGKSGVALGALGATATGLTAHGTVSQAGKARRWNDRMDKIKAKARERAGSGEYGRGRQVPVGKTYVGGGVYRSLASLSPKARGTVARNIRSGSGFGASPQQRAADTLRGLSSRQPNPNIYVEAGKRADARSMRRAKTGNATSTSVPGLSVDARMPAGVRSIVESQAAGLKLKGPTTVRWNKKRNSEYGNYTVDSPGPTGRGRSVVLSARAARGADPKIVRHELEHAVGGSRKGRVTSIRLRRMPNRSVQNEEARADAASMTVGGKRRLGSWYPNVFGDMSQYGRRFREITGRKARPHSMETYRRNNIASAPELKPFISGKDGKGAFYQGVRQARENAKAVPNKKTRMNGEIARRASRQDTREAVGSLQRAGASERLANRRDFFSKGLLPVIRPRIPLAARRPVIRGGFIGTSASGRKFSVRGSLPR